jgi:hypothetical protein
MPAGRRSFSRLAPALAAGVALIALAGCSGHLPVPGEASSPGSLRLAPIADEKVVAAPAAAPRFLPAADSPAVDDIVPAAYVQPKSAWCNYLAADAAADAVVLRAPILGGEVDDEGHGSLSLSLSMSGLRKADLVERAAEAHCRRHLAVASLEKLVFLAPHELSTAGFSAHAEVIERRRAELEKIRVRIRSEVEKASVTAGEATRLLGLIDSLYSTASEARSQADRRQSAEGSLSGQAAEYSANLLRAESDIADLGSQMRTADAFDVSLEAGYRDDELDDGFDRLAQGVNGSIKFSMKLGAFTASRYESEKRAREARLAATRSPEGGVLWQIETLRKIHLRAIDGLEDARLEIERSMAEARRFEIKVVSVEAPEFVVPAIEVRLRLIQLEAERAAVTGSLAEIRGKLRKLAPG